MKNKQLYPFIDEAIRTKRFIGGLGILKKDGSIVKLNGQIFTRKTIRGGEEVIVMDNFLGKARPGSKGNKRWQMVHIKNLIALNGDKWRMSRAA